MESKEVHIVGGGLSGLITALHLLKNGFEVTIYERSPYPKHKVCGEYISNEVLPYLKSLGIDPQGHGAVILKKLQCSSAKGRGVVVDLPLGGFGLSRYTLDHIIYKEVLLAGGKVLKEQVENILFYDHTFEIKTYSGKTFKADIVVGAYGKRANLDITLSRKFIQQKSPWMAVKSHYKADFQSDLVGLHNFDGGYCGISNVEHGLVNVCYLAQLNSFQQYKDLTIYQEQVLRKNKYLNDFFKNAISAFEKPLTISQISFDRKERVANHILMCGDSASLIHPLCGNGMAMAIMGARILSTCIIKNRQNRGTRQELENAYTHQWENEFRARLQWGRGLQRILIKPMAANLGIATMQHTPRLFKKLIEQTHGKMESV